jgi:hypothetical protein
MKNFSAIGFEIAKQVFQVHGLTKKRKLCYSSNWPEKMFWSGLVNSSLARSASRLAPCIVAIKTREQQQDQMLPRSRELLVTQRMQASNALRAIRLNSAPCFRRCLW